MKIIIIIIIIITIIITIITIITIIIIIITIIIMKTRNNYVESVKSSSVLMLVPKRLTFLSKFPNQRPWSSCVVLSMACGRPITWSSYMTST